MLNPANRQARKQLNPLTTHGLVHRLPFQEQNVSEFLDSTFGERLAGPNRAKNQPNPVLAEAPLREDLEPLIVHELHKEALCAGLL